MTQIFTAKTVEDANALASRTFGVDHEEIRFEILEEPKKSLFGRWKGEAKVRASYVEVSITEKEEISVEDVIEEPEFSTPVENIVEIPEQETSVATENSESTQNIEDTEDLEEPENTSETDCLNVDMSKSELSEELEIAVSEKIQAVSEASEESISVTDLITGEASPESLEKIEHAKNYLVSVLSAMNIQAVLHVQAGAESVLIEIETKNSGAIIGKHGDTLDALQYLTFMAANHGAKEYYRIILDTAGYRERRRKTLEELATKIAANVLRTNRQRTLEPMNPYERRIIHSVIAETAGVVSKSIGEEPYRKIMILPENQPERPARRRNSYKNSRQGSSHSRSRSGYRRSMEKDQEMPSSRISMDSMKTDFEKGYKRPRPEDELNTGLYGKLNFD
ncbi:MAG: Jag N-terminal domain-containing protein [Oscillospiraceae bacterium]|nr:Jag N-terminal domain-containing protein [Oscillospiraceae bacterium]